MRQNRWPNIPHIYQLPYGIYPSSLDNPHLDQFSITIKYECTDLLNLEDDVSVSLVFSAKNWAKRSKPIADQIDNLDLCVLNEPFANKDAADTNSSPYI